MCGRWIRPTWREKERKTFSKRQLQCKKMRVKHRCDKIDVGRKTVLLSCITSFWHFSLCVTLPLYLEIDWFRDRNDVWQNVCQWWNDRTYLLANNMLTPCILDASLPTFLAKRSLERKNKNMADNLSFRKQCYVCQCQINCNTQTVQSLLPTNHVHRDNAMQKQGLQCSLRGDCGFYTRRFLNPKIWMSNGWKMQKVWATQPKSVDLVMTTQHQRETNCGNIRNAMESRKVSTPDFFLQSSSSSNLQICPTLYVFI